MCLSSNTQNSRRHYEEVDAALDLSHTQNIGRMIRAHFPYSQFIVVSLKVRRCHAVKSVG